MIAQQIYIIVLMVVSTFLTAMTVTGLMSDFEIAVAWGIVTIWGLCASMWEDVPMKIKMIVTGAFFCILLLGSILRHAIAFRLGLWDF